MAIWAHAMPFYADVHRPWSWQRQSPVYIVKILNSFYTCLNVIKAFNWVHYGKLLNTLLNCCTPPCIMKLYANNSIQVSWLGNEWSFCRNEWREASPSCYASTLTIYCCSCPEPVGCYIGKLFAGALAAAMRKMLFICNKSAVDNDNCFNAEQSKCVSLWLLSLRFHVSADTFASRDASFPTPRLLMKTL